MKLCCAIVGDTGGAFEVGIDEGASVSALTKAITNENLRTIRCDSNDLQLFLAKKDNGNGAWLTEEEVASLRDESVSLSFRLMKTTLLLKDTENFGEGFQPGEEQVHVLVLVPKIGLKRPAEDEPTGSAILKRLKTMTLEMADTKKFMATEMADIKKIMAAELADIKRMITSELADIKRMITSELADIKTALAVIKAELVAMKPKTLTDFKTLSVCEDEFRLDNLSKTQQGGSPIVETPHLHKFWKGFGEFPSHYFVRLEEVMFWKVIKKLLFSESPIVIVGSPGVGKSCFLMLLAFYLACIEKRKVLVIRRLTGPKHANAVVLFDGQGSYAGLFDLSSRDIAATRDQARSAIVLVDGFDQEEVQAPANSLAPFHLLATSCQYDVKQSDPSSTVVLPAWRFDDLLKYAKLTNWVIDTGLRETKELKDSTWSKLVEEQYFYSGGSLGEFCEERKLLKTRVGNHSCAVVNSQEFELMDSYIGWKEESPEDRLRRHYIADIHEEEHYSYCVFWKLAVDSGYVLRKLGRSVDTNKLLEICKYAKSIDTGFHGVAYELLLHNVVHAASGKRKPIVLKMREGSEYEKIEILVREVVSRGEDEASCYAYLSTLGKDTYWYPDYPFFPFIGAVTTCKAFRSGSTDSETILAYIQVTIQSEEKFKEKRLHQLNEVIDTNPLLKGMKRAFVIVSPDSNVCERFILRRAPETKMFPTMVSCFNPEQQEA